ncbi:MAG: hypothetical protein KBD15_01340 [Candidatus Magasanikbacteria bacterium]|jgi:hypothetical protein|nr:hypothetical protein [Candidatus Magasanikbacteria bacterium]
MKKIILFTIAVLLLPISVHAYVEYQRDYLFFSYGLGSLTIEPQTKNCDPCSGFIIRGLGAEQVYIDTSTQHVSSVLTQNDIQRGMLPLEPNEAYVRIPANTRHNYALWKIHGTVEEKPFVLVGLSMEGELIENKLFMHGLIAGAVVLVLVGLIVYIKKKV